MSKNSITGHNRQRRLTKLKLEESKMTELVKSTRLWINPSLAPDVVGYKLYMVPNTSPLLRDPSGDVLGAQVFDLGNPAPDGNNKLWFDLEVLPNMTSNDGVYNLGISAVDGAGNESSFLELLDITLDFVAPDAPPLGGIERS